MSASVEQLKHQDAELVTRAVTNAADILGLNSAQLAAVIGASTATVSRMRRARAVVQPGQKFWELALLLIRLYRSLDAICAGDADAMRAWMHNYNHDLNGVPVEMIVRVEGLTTTLAYVDSRRAVA